MGVLPRKRRKSRRQQTADIDRRWNTPWGRIQVNAKDSVMNSVAFALRSVRLALLLSTLAYATAAGAADDPLERGAYLAKAGSCMTCHTPDGGDPYGGGVAFHTNFGTIYSTNISSSADAGIGSWTEEQFIRAMRKGKSADGANLYPAFPYTSFTNMTDQDIKDLFVYIQSVAPSPYTPPKNKLNFPFNIRSLLGVWKAMYLKIGPFKPDESKSEEWNRGAYLVEGVSHCGACHTPRSALGGLDRKKALSGSVYNDKVNGDKIRPWSAVNLTPAPDGLAIWSEDDIADYLKTGHSSVAGTFGPMNKVIVNSTSHLTDSDTRAMAVYLKSLPPIEQARQHKMKAPDFQEAELIYTIHCGTCHLPTGLGDSSTGTPLAGSAVVQAKDPASLINVIIYGAEVPSPAPPGAWKSMEAFGDKLDDDEIALLSTYLRSNWDSRGGPVSEADVAKQR